MTHTTTEPQFQFEDENGLQHWAQFGNLDYVLLKALGIQMSNKDFLMVLI